jgi:uncharacterized glyoxalase superfamily protein PhnB
MSFDSHVSASRRVSLGVVSLVVTDMSAALAFYRRLGLEIPAGADGEPHVEVEVPGGLRLAWDTVETVRSYDSRWQPQSGGPRVSLAFRVDTAEDVDALYGRLVEAGYNGHLAPWDAFWGQRYAVIHDPDGNGVDLFCPV